jgi:hypothetical protein
MAMNTTETATQFCEARFRSTRPGHDSVDWVGRGRRRQCAVMGDKPYNGIFIRGPAILELGEGVEGTLQARHGPQSHSDAPQYKLSG